MSGKTNADKVLDSVNKVGGALTRQLVAGDKPKVIKTAGMDIAVSQVGDDVDEEEAGFKLPKMSSLFNSSDGANAESSVGAMVSLLNTCRCGQIELRLFAIAIYSAVALFLIISSQRDQVSRVNV